MFVRIVLLINFGENMIKLISMKKVFLFLFFLSVSCLSLKAQAYHNYFNPQMGYVQIGFLGQYIHFRYASEGIPFTTLNHLGNQQGLVYYGNSQMQVAVNSNSSKVCVMSAQGSAWYNYVGPVPVPNPYGASSTYNNSNSQSGSKCPWCNGKGRITKNDHVTQYTSNDYTVTERCGECGYEFIRTYTNHYHLNCGHCGGTGYIR